MANKNDKYQIRVLNRALRLLNTLSDSKPRTLTEISRELELDSSSVFRILSTLSSQDYTEKNEKTGEYHLGVGVLKLTQGYFEGNDLRHYAIEELGKLRDTTSETVHLGILDDMNVVYIEKFHGHHAIGYMSSQVGGRSPAHCTGIGKVLLAYLDANDVITYYSKSGIKKFTNNTITNISELADQLVRIKQKGYALDKGEHEAEVRCVAAPVFDMSNSVIAAISVSGPAARMDPISDRRDLIDETVLCSKKISAKLGMAFTP